VATATLPTKSLLPLAPFSHEWVGGDIHGLASFAGTLYGYVPEMADVVTALDKKVSQIVSDAGWRGSAATAFTGNWEKISAEVNAVGLVVIQTGVIVDELAADLSKIENALEKAAAEAAAHGVQVGGDGEPPQVCYANKTQEDWRVGYNTFYLECKAAAENARVQAAGALHGVFTAVSPGQPGKSVGADSSDTGTKIGEGSTITDLLTDLFATKTAYANEVRATVAEATTKEGKAFQAWKAAQAAARQADGRFGVMPDDVKQGLKDARSELASAETDLTKAEAGENAFTKVLGTRMKDLPGLSDLARDLDDGSLLDRALDIPVVDIVAGGISTVINAQQDISKGVPPWAAYPLETGGTIASIAAGTVAATFVGGAVAGLSIAGAPVLGVAAGVVVGGAVAYGVGDYIHNYIADFGQQWHEHGVLGIVTDFGAAGESTWDDTKQLAGDIGHAASSVWHGITSLF